MRGGTAVAAMSLTLDIDQPALGTWTFRPGEGLKRLPPAGAVSAVLPLVAKRLALVCDDEPVWQGAVVNGGY